MKRTIYMLLIILLLAVSTNAILWENHQAKLECNPDVSYSLNNKFEQYCELTNKQNISRDFDIAFLFENKISSGSLDYYKITDNIVEKNISINNVLSIEQTSFKICDYGLGQTQYNISTDSSNNIYCIDRSVNFGNGSYIGYWNITEVSKSWINLNSQFKYLNIPSFDKTDAYYYEDVSMNPYEKKDFKLEYRISGNGKWDFWVGNIATSTTYYLLDPFFNNTFYFKNTTDFGYGTSIDFNDAELYYVIIEADAIGGGFVANGNELEEYETGKWILWEDDEADVATSRAQIIKTLFYGTTGSNPRMDSAFVTNITALRTSDSNDVGKRGHFASIAALNTNSFGQFYTGVFNVTTDNTVSSWSRIFSGPTVSQWEIPEGTTRNSASSTTSDETGTDTSGDDVANPADAQIQLSAQNTNRDGRVIVLAKGSIEWTHTGSSTPIPTFSDIDFFIDNGIPEFTNVETALFTFLSNETTDNLSVNNSQITVVVNYPSTTNQLNDSTLGNDLISGDCYNFVGSELNWSVQFNETFGAINTDLFNYSFQNCASYPVNISISNAESGNNLICTFDFFSINSSTNSSTTYEWYINTIDQNINNSILSFGNTSVNDNITCEVFTQDSRSLTSSARNSSSITIVDTQDPVLSGINVSSTTITEDASGYFAATCVDTGSDVLKVLFNITDPDGFSFNDLENTSQVGNEFRRSQSFNKLGTWTYDAVQCFDNNGLTSTNTSVGISIVVSAAATPPGGGGGGGSSGPDKEDCNIEFIPSSLNIVRNSQIVQLQLVNKEEAVITPGYVLSSAISADFIINVQDTDIQPGATGRTNIVFIGDSSLNKSGILTFTSDNCVDEIIPIMVSQSVAQGLTGITSFSSLGEFLINFLLGTVVAIGIIEIKGWMILIIGAILGFLIARLPEDINLFQRIVIFLFITILFTFAISFILGLF